MKVCLVNDTSQKPHYGCRITSHQLRLALRELDWSVTRVHQGHQLLDPTLRECRGVVINGEGTFHDEVGSRYLYDVACKAVKFGRPVALVNTVAQGLPKDLDLNIFSVISVREGLSYSVIRNAGYKGPLWKIMDASLATHGAPFMSSERSGVVVTDSVLEDDTGDLERLVRQLGATWFPFKNEAQLVEWEDALRVIGKASLLLTGRFHGVCCAVIMGTPFIAVESNTHKISGFLQDMGCLDLLVDSVQDMRYCMEHGSLRPVTVDARDVRRDLHTMLGVFHGIVESSCKLSS